MRFKKITDYFALPCYCGLIFWLSSQSILPKHDIFAFQDKWDHMLAYMVMGVLAIRWLFRLSQSKLIAYTGAFLFCVLYGASDEWHQSFVSGRDSSLLDWLADSVGAVLAVVTYHIAQAMHNKKIMNDIINK